SSLCYHSHRNQDRNLRCPSSRHRYGGGGSHLTSPILCLEVEAVFVPQPHDLILCLQNLQVLQYLVLVEAREGGELREGAGPPGEEVTDQIHRHLREVSAPFSDHLGAGEDLQHPIHLVGGE